MHTPTLTVVRPDLRHLRGGPRGCVPALGAARRLQALAAAGWPPKPIARVARLERRTINRIRGGERAWVRRNVDTEIAAAYDLLSSLNPQQVLPATHTAHLAISNTLVAARKAGWCYTPEDWLDFDLDDPDIDPTIGARVRDRRVRTGTAADVLELIEAGSLWRHVHEAWDRTPAAERVLVVAALSDPAQRGGAWTVPAIAEHVGTTTRTVIRYRQQARALAEAS